MQKRQDHLRQRERERERSEQLVERRLGHRLVELLDAVRERRLDLGEARRTLAAQADSSPERGESGGLRGGQPGGDVLAHQMHAPLVLLGEETKPACGAVRAQEPIARLPRAQQFGAHTNASAELADAQSWTVGHEVESTESPRKLYKSSTLNLMTLKPRSEPGRRRVARSEHRALFDRALILGAP